MPVAGMETPVVRRAQSGGALVFRVWTSAARGICVRRHPYRKPSAGPRRGAQAHHPQPCPVRPLRAVARPLRRPFLRLGAARLRADSPSSPSPSSRARHGSMNSCNCCVPVRASQRRNMSSLPRGISSCGLRYAMKGLSKCTRRAPCPAYPASSSTIASSSGITPMLQSRPNRGTGSASTRLWTNCSCGPLPEGPQPTPRQGSLQPTVSCPTAITPCVRPSGCCCNHFGQHAARGGFVRFRQGPSCFLGQG